MPLLYQGLPPLLHGLEVVDVGALDQHWDLHNACDEIIAVLKDLQLQGTGNTIEFMDFYNACDEPIAKGLKELQGRGRDNSIVIDNRSIAVR